MPAGDILVSQGGSVAYKTLSGGATINSSGVLALSAVAVSNGGTGQTTLTPYAVLCGGTTSTAAVQPVASVGTSGQVLTSNGAAAMPTFQAPATGTVAHLIGSTSAPTVVIGASGAGTNATASLTGTDLSGTITLNTSALDTPSGSSTILTVTFSTAYGSAPVILMMPSNDAAWALAFGVIRLRDADITTTTFTLRSGTVPLPALTGATYTWNYIVAQ